MESQDKTVMAKQPVGYSVGGFTVGNLATMVRSTAVGTIIALGERDGQQTVTLEFEQPQPVDAPEGATATRFELSWRNISSTWAAPSISNVADAPANALVEPRKEGSIGSLSRPRTYGDDQALMVVAAYRMGLEPGLLDDAIKQLEGKPLHPMTGAAISQEACRMNELLRHDATLIERANTHVKALMAEYGFA